MATFTEPHWRLFSNVNYPEQLTMSSHIAPSHLYSHSQSNQHSNMQTGNDGPFVPRQTNQANYFPSPESDYCLASPEATFQVHQWPLTWPGQNAIVSPPESLLSSSEDVGGYLPHSEGQYTRADGAQFRVHYSPSPSHSPMPQERSIDHLDPELHFRSSSAAYSTPSNHMNNESGLVEPPILMATELHRAQAHTYKSSEEPDESTIESSEGDMDEGPEDDSDQDYNPRRSTRSKASSRGQRRQSQRSSGERRSKISKAAGSSGGRKGRTSASDNRRKSSASSTQSIRPFTCPLSPYGCNKTFATKNEWKRHVVIQHLALEYYRCDLCPDSQSRPNDFNRKDLFVQHLRRMHIQPEQAREAVRDRSQISAEEEVEAILARCLVKMRQAPTEFFCIFCKGPFAGKGSYDEWLEHLGKHLAAMPPQQATEAPWLQDHTFKQWLMCNGRLRHDRSANTWALSVTIGPDSRSPGEAVCQEEDAEGEPDD